MTDAIKRFKHDLEKLHPAHTVYHGLSAGDLLNGIVALETEREALRGALEPFADMAPALRGSGATLLGDGKVLQVPDKYLSDGKGGYRFVRVSNFTKAEAALASAPSDIALVPLDKLREIEWVFIPDGTSCPVCLQRNFDGHAPDCWLASLIGKTKG